jgi:arsenate reductase-like glutaredoxin family protein
VNSNEMQKVVEAYERGGEEIFDSAETLAAALDKDVKALTDDEKALLENKSATLELVESMAEYNATLKATLI